MCTAPQAIGARKPHIAHWPGASRAGRSDNTVHGVLPTCALHAQPSGHGLWTILTRKQTARSLALGGAPYVHNAMCNL